ncbi:beta 1-4 rhamnosyltransferase Cps2T [Streptococcus pantholopis]|uniref:Glycosyl transferase n=1 Tax=Streptococcus pantholopis TaxID=1811193 RepID=A0A172Q6V3_9STRE|nr:DUF1972 domain-containing protein [Streptococcus pantholopis]AND79147.1 glycosyl transferase [Streptococcus pantholopis]
MQHIFIIGSRGLPAKYGGFETFVEELIKTKKSKAINYHVACLSDEEHHSHFTYLGADCFTIKAPKIGPARVIAYDMMAIHYSLSLIKKEKIASPIFYILGNTIGAFIGVFKKKIQRAGGRLYVNPDGLEWKRSKWSKPVQTYLKYAEKCMAAQADLVIADNIGIEHYIKQAYPNTRTRFIAYGTDLSQSSLKADSPSVLAYFERWGLKQGQYYLLVGRFVPENNYETVIRAFMQTQTQRDLLIICNHEGSPFFEKLKAATRFEEDKRVKFAGTVYDHDLLNYLREHAFAYIHGHEVGGTNPGLLEALAHTDLNLVLGVDFNRSVAGEAALYWNKEESDLAQLLERVDGQTDFSDLAQNAKEVVSSRYTWEKITKEYEDLFLNES